ncbi:Fic family protein [uncultured Aquimarina sp.]|uniref:Fic family protein n=1 Tax=uncultured Aquimarina sp. TaxID=575652 RepID=UPI00262E2A02|nr:Fic family protein [uncultured Aquimarina sp.]
MTEEKLSELKIISEVDTLKVKVEELGQGNSTLLKIAQESFIIGSKSHLNSLNPEIREELGLQLDYLTQQDPRLKSSYIEKKNRYLSLGKSFASISFLFDLVDIKFTLLDLLLLQEILMDNGDYRKSKVYIQHPDGSKIEFDYKTIDSELNKLFQWYYRVNANNKISSLVIAVLFHYKMVSIHPFLDGNGRISRLILNLILLKNGFFPITIPNEKRKEYYECLVIGDRGNFEPLVQFFGKLTADKLNQYLTLAGELDEIGDNKEYLVLTEDGNTDMISKLLEIHQMDLDKVQVESYEGKDNLASAIFFAKKLKEKSKNLRGILIHRDRDNDNPQQLNQIINRQLKNYQLDSITTVLITKFYDIESYFLNQNHINKIYPSISIERAKELIEQATIETEPTSKAKLRKAYAQYGKYGKMEDPKEKADEIDALYDTDPIKFRYGKDVLWKLEELITTELQLTDKISLTTLSEFIKVTEIEKLKA